MARYLGTYPMDVSTQVKNAARVTEESDIVRSSLGTFRSMVRAVDQWRSAIF